MFTENISTTKRAWFNNNANFFFIVLDRSCNADCKILRRESKESF